MALSIWCLLAFLSVSISAQIAGNKVLARQLQPTGSFDTSVISVLATAIPADSTSQILADPTGFASSLISSVSAGNPPQWYQDLPDDVKSIFMPLDVTGTPAQTTGGTRSAAETSSRRSASASLTASALRPTGTEESSLPSSTSNEVSSGSNGGLTTGAKIGIGVGVPAAVLVVGAIIGAFIVGKRRGSQKVAQEQTPDMTSPPPYVEPNRPELQGSHVPAQGDGREAQLYQQLYGQPHRPDHFPEMWTPANVHEMHAGQRDDTTRK